MLKKSLVFICILSLSFWGYNKNTEKKYWIFFKDKGKQNEQIEESLSHIKSQLPNKVLRRRAKVLPPHRIVDISDLPINQSYIDKLHKLHIKPIIHSKWLNAISARLSPEQVKLVKKLPFVKKIQPVISYIRRIPIDDNLNLFPKLFSPNDQFSLDYGNSYTQNSIMHVPEVHQMGVNGTGILVGMLDTGFNYQEHEAFTRLEVIAEHDFINNDDVTRNEYDDNDSKSQHNHGTQTLSSIAGFKEGQLIGPAYGANYILGKTEDVRDEYKTEEDNWVAGIEWMEENGVDIVNSSLGYNAWYTYADMDGNTAITTVAADMAVKKGVVVVNSMGNEGNNWWRYMIAPADGDSVISVGAVYSDGQLTSFSSIGPTWDGRIKPDVVAMGSGVDVVSPNSTNSYTYSSGTSFSSPLTAGVAALILSAHPYLTPIQLREALRNTANNFRNPNNEYGWGLINASDAIFYYGLFFSNLPTVSTDEKGHKIKIKIFSKRQIVQDSVFIYYSIGNNPFIKMNLFASSSENEYQQWIPLQKPATKIRIYFSAVDESGDLKFHPYNAPAEYFTFFAYDTIINPKKEPKIPTNFTLYQNYPNPFNDKTIIKYDILIPCYVKISIYNINGQFIKTLTNQFHQTNSYQEIWDGNNEKGLTVGSGVYFYKIEAGLYLKTKKMLLLR